MLHPITVMESDCLQALLADMYSNYTDVEVLAYPMIGLVGRLTPFLPGALSWVLLPTR